MEGQAKIHAAMLAVMADAGAIAKTRRNQQQSYDFRGIDDVYNELHDVMARNGVFTTGEVTEQKREEKPSKSGGVLTSAILTIRYTFWAADGSSVQTTVVGEGMDSGDKASNKAMAVAHKYALLQAFCIPTADAKDPENDSPEPAKGNESTRSTQIPETKTTQQRQPSTSVF